VKIDLHPHTSSWADIFAMEKRRIARELGDLAHDIEHIGSTAVPGLLAKPIIDVHVGVVSLERFDDARGVQRMESLGLSHRHEFLAAVPFRRLFSRAHCSAMPGMNVHLVAHDHPWGRRHLAFRDYLRANAAALDVYAQAKRELAQREWSSVGDYADAKTDVVWKLEDEAFAWLGLSDDDVRALRTSRIA